MDKYFSKVQFNTIIPKEKGYICQEYTIYLEKKVVSYVGYCGPGPDMEKITENMYYNKTVPLSDEQYRIVCELCKIRDFLPYQNRTMSREDKGYETDRPKWMFMYFSGITDTMTIEWQMLYHYEEEYEWPSDKLYRYLMQIFFDCLK